jgi:hypothetical protein
MKYLKVLKTSWQIKGKWKLPHMETGCCLGPERNGVNMEGGGEGGRGPPERGKDKQLMPSKGRDNMEKDEEEQPNQT